MYVYDGNDRIYLTKDATQRFYYIDLSTNRLELAGMAPYVAGAAVAGSRLEVITTTDGMKFLYTMRHSGVEWWRMLIWW